MKFKLVCTFALAVLFAVANPTPTEAYASTTTFTSTEQSLDATDSVEVLQAVAGAGLGAGAGGVGSYFYHRKKTTGVFNRTENLVWDKSKVEITDKEYVKTYTTVNKDFYKSKK